ncbi:MAG: ubiquinone biosynthesis protein UbiH, partial [Xanthomonas perforans]|nr:ubiquinone biosynthesis protein UbiH [Xanthomonas perforans]
MNMRSTASSPGALVVGTGTAGLATALALARRNVPVSLLGPKPALPPASADVFDPRVYAVSPASQAFLAELGVWDMLPPERMARLDAMHVTGNAPATATLGDIDAAPPRAGEVHLTAWQGNLPALAWVIEGRELERALRQAVAVLGVRWTTERFASLSRSADDTPWTVSTDTGRTLSADLLIGADGAGSPLRQAAGIGWHGSAYDATGLVVHLDVERPHQGVAQQWFTPDGVLALLPMADSPDGAQVSMVWSMRRAQADALLALPATEQAAQLEARLRRVAGDWAGRLR